MGEERRKVLYRRRLESRGGDCKVEEEVGKYRRRLEREVQEENGKSRRRLERVG
jgi:hypothetical protein